MRVRVLVLLALCLSVLAASPARAQEDDDTCSILVERAIALSDQHCKSLDRNQVCYGNDMVSALPWEDAIALAFETPGDIELLDRVSSVSTFPLDPISETWGIVLLKVQANLPGTIPGQGVTFLLFGDVSLENEISPGERVTVAEQPTQLQAVANTNANLRTEPSTSGAIAGVLVTGETVTVTGINPAGDWLQIIHQDSVVWCYASLLDVTGDAETLPVVDGSQLPPPEETVLDAPFQAFRFRTGIGEPVCEEAPGDGLLIQAPQETRILFRINGIDVVVGSTALVETLDTAETRISTLAGEVTVATSGISQIIEPGYQTVLTETTVPVEPEAYDYDAVRNVPVDLLPDPVSIPIVIPPSVLWVDTGVQIQVGQTFTVTASGAWDQTRSCHSEVDSGIYEGSYEDCLATTPQSPAGHPKGLTGNMLGHPPVWPLMDVPMGALIGRVGDGAAFGILEGGSFTTTAAGTLYLGNNIPGELLLHDGAYVAIVKVE